MILKIPFCSQYDDAIETDWQSRVCTLACLKMAFDFLFPKDNVSVNNLVIEANSIINDLIRRGLLVKDHTSHGWPHDVIVFVSHNHGIPAYKEEFKSVKVDLETNMFAPGIFEKEMTDIGVERIIQAIVHKRPVIVSITKPNDSYHTVLVVGFEGDEKNPTQIIYHDPDTKDGGSSFQKIPVSDFLKKWRKLAIFLG